MSVIWNMKDIVEVDDTCISVNIVSEDTIGFETLNGTEYRVEIKEGEIHHIK